MGARASAVAFAAWLGIAGVSAGCAQTVVKDECGRRTGIQYHTAKAYVLKLPPTGTTPSLSLGAAESHVVVLPDLEHPQYVVQSPGLGKGGFTVDMTKGDKYTGALTSFAQKETDVRADKVIGAVAGVGTGIIGALIVADQIDKIK